MFARAAQRPSPTLNAVAVGEKDDVVAPIEPLSQKMAFTAPLPSFSLARMATQLPRRIKSPVWQPQNQLSINKVHPF